MTEVDPPPHADSGVPAASGAQRRGRVRIFLRDVLIIFSAAIIISLGIKTFLVRSFYIPSGSMENTLQIDDRIIVNELKPRFAAVDHGDVVVFEDPGGWLRNTAPAPAKPAGPVNWFLETVGLTASDANDHLIKRVIGLPGDEVVCCDEFGQMTVNGVPLDEPYLKPVGDGVPPEAVEFDVTVPDDSLWVMGDNRGNSLDSRFNQDTSSRGFVPMENVVGRAFVITWPVSRWSWLDDYPATFRGVEGSG